MSIPAHPYKTLGSYFKNRVLVYDTEVGRKCFHITSGAPQGSILGPVLWNVMYDEVLRLEFSVEVEVFGFADDNTHEVYGESIEKVELTSTHLIKVVEDPGNWSWLSTKLKRVAYAYKRASTTTVALSRMMSHSSAASVATSILRYGGPAWGNALSTESYRGKLESTYRLMCLKVASAYRTVSHGAVWVITGMVPIGILIWEDME